MTPRHAPASPHALAPFNVDAIVQRLRQCVPQLRLVGTAADYASVQELSAFTPPSAFVIVASETPQPGPAPGARAVAVAVRFGVVLAVRCHRAGVGRGLDASLGDELRSIAAAQRQALLGWQPPGTACTPLQWAGAQVLDYDASTILQAEAWQTTHILRMSAAPPPTPGAVPAP